MRHVLVRHGEAAAGWDADMDPGLSPLGVEQAAANAALLASGPVCPLLTSPLRRARETAAPLAEAWGVDARVEPAIGEIPSPTSDLAERGAWLSRFMARTWDEAGPELLSWRAHLLNALNSQAAATVMFTHFIAINAAVGEASGDRRVVCFLPDNASRTVLDVSDGRLTVVELGAEARTAVR